MKSKRIVKPDAKIKRDLKICAFNIQIFGVAKMADDFVRTNLIKIFKNFDLVAVQGKRWLHCSIDDIQKALTNVAKKFGTQMETPFQHLLKL